VRSGDAGRSFQLAASTARCHNGVPSFALRQLISPPMTAAATPTILVFDSGLGGLTVFREIIKVRPDARFIYVADDAVFPYGAIEEASLVTHIVAMMTCLIEAHRPDLVVIACNTASTMALASLRARFSVPFVGTVPAIKPACAASLTKCISVLGTKATVTHEYTQGLIREFAAGCHITLIGSARLATLAEAALGGGRVGDREIAAEIAPCFINGDRRTDTVVLACTHYPLLLDHFTRLAPWPVNFIDPAAAIARRVIDLIGQARRNESVPTRAIFTSGRVPGAALAATLRAFGIDEIAALDRHPASADCSPRRRRLP
jgi:glutamate racemase